MWADCISPHHVLHLSIIGLSGLAFFDSFIIEVLPLACDLAPGLPGCGEDRFAPLCGHTAAQDHVAIGLVELDEPRGGSGPLCRHQRAARAAEAIEDDVARIGYIDHRVREQLNRIRGRVLLEHFTRIAAECAGARSKPDIGISQIVMDEMSDDLDRPVSKACMRYAVPRRGGRIRLLGNPSNLPLSPSRFALSYNDVEWGRLGVQQIQ